jgi:hypothetical protein
MKRKYQRNGMPNAINRQYQASEAEVKLKRKSNKPDWMSKYKITYANIAEAFGYSNANSFYNAHCREDIISGVEWLIGVIENK